MILNAWHRMMNKLFGGALVDVETGGRRIVRNLPMDLLWVLLQQYRNLIEEDDE